MLSSAVLFTTALLTSAPPATRIAVLIEENGSGSPATAAIERRLQSMGYEVVAAEVSKGMRDVVAPKDVLNNRLPSGRLSVFEADALLAGEASYGEPQDIEGVKSQPISLMVRLLDLGTGQATATLQAEGVGVGVGGPALKTRGVEQATEILFSKNGLTAALKKVGQSAGSVTLVVQALPNREALLELKKGLEKALAGAPVREIYFARGLGKLVLGGSKSDHSMVGPDIADIIAAKQNLALTVDEVANTRIVARYDKARTVNVHALVVEPRLPRRNAKRANELGKYVATQIATFDFARASYQRGRLSRRTALKRAKSIGADVLVESEVLGRKGAEALAIRIIDVNTGRPILRQQTVLKGHNSKFGAAEELISTLKGELPEKLSQAMANRTKTESKTLPTTARKN